MESGIIIWRLPCAPGGAESNDLFPIDNRTGNKHRCKGDREGRPYDVKVMFTINLTFTAVGTGLAPVKTFP